MRATFAVAALAVACCAALGAGTGEIVVEGKHEVLYLDGIAAPSRWRPAECTVEAATKLKAEGRPTLHVHMPVDYHAGQKQYPVGWPRLYLTLNRSTEGGWHLFERFEFMAYATMSRPTPPKSIIALQIHCPDKHRAISRNLEEIRLGQWVRISIPTRRIKGVADVRVLGLNIAESNYKHGDDLHFYFGGFRLVRSAEFSLNSLAIRNKALFHGQPRLKVEVEVGGPPLKIARALPLTIRGGKQVVRTESLPVKPGLQTLLIDIHELKLAPGTYTLAAFDNEPDKRKSDTFRVVETPWKQ